MTIPSHEVTRAIGILNAAVRAGQLLPAAIPEDDAMKIMQAEHIVVLARQAKAVADEIGPSAIPNYPGIMEVIEEAEVFVGVGSQPGPASPTPVASMTPVPAPSPAQAPTATMNGQEHPQGSDVPPEDTGLPTPPPTQSPPPAPTPAPTPEPDPVPPPALQQEPGEPVPGELWRDANGGIWLIETSRGGPQLEARFDNGDGTLGPPTILPRGFIKDRVADAPVAAQPAPLPVVPEPVVVPQQEVPPSAPSPSLPSPPQPPTTPSTPAPPSPPSSPQPSPVSPSPSTSPTESQPEAQAAVRPRWKDGKFDGFTTEAAPVDDSEGDDEYAKLLDHTTALYTPYAMPTPKDLEDPPGPGAPEDLTAVLDPEAQKLHSQYNALAARARYLRGLEAAKARDCGRVRDKYLKPARRKAREVLGKDVTLTEVTDLAEDDVDVAKWIERVQHHQDRADAFQTFFHFYTENVAVLSRDWTMRAKEESGS